MEYGRVRPEVVVRDVEMPGVDGVEATRRLRAEMPEVRIIGLSVHEEEEVAKAMIAAGADAYLTKLVPTEELVQAIRNIT